MLRTIFLIIFCLFVRDAYGADKWLRARSRDFVVVGNAGEGDIRRVARYLEEFRSAVAMVLPKVTQISSVPTTVIVKRRTPIRR